MAVRDKTKKDIFITQYDIENIKKMVCENKPAQYIAGLLNSKYNFAIETYSGFKYNNDSLKEFSHKLSEGWYSVNEVKEIIDNISALLPVNTIKKDDTFKLRAVTELKVGDIVIIENLGHLFLILNVYKSGLFKGVGLSSKPSLRNSLSIKSRFLQNESYVRLTVSINEIEEFKSKWIGSVSQLQVKLVKEFLKQNKL